MSYPDPATGEGQRDSYTLNSGGATLMSNTLIHTDDPSDKFSSQSSVENSTSDDKKSMREEASITPGEIAIGVIIGRASEYFDFFVYAIA